MPVVPSIKRESALPEAVIVILLPSSSTKVTVPSVFSLVEGDMVATRACTGVFVRTALTALKSNHIRANSKDCYADG